jgi:GR25 family glycosyltransferase involved in LPS biosynthesis
MNIPEIYCINLKIRNEKRNQMKKQFKRRKLNVKFHIVELHQNPKMGCINSHFEIIKKAKEKKLPYVLILEDDAKFLKGLNSIPTPPDDWDMLYLGGYIKERFSELNSNWDCISSWCTHAYIIHSRIYDQVLDNFDSWAKKQDPDKVAIDEYYIDFIHQNKKSYIVKPQMIVQFDGYSDIDKNNNKWKNFDWDNHLLNEKIEEAEMEITKEGYGILKSIPIDDQDLPKVSIITPTYNRKNIFPVALRNFYFFDYPREKMEWIICDDGQQDLKPIIPEDSRIRYIKASVDGKLNVSQKRNLCIQHCSHDIIVHMDDDDYYFPHSLKSRVKTLLKYKNKKCVSSKSMGYYHLMDNYSFVKGCYDSNKNLIYLPEASMAYYKSFWEERNFDERVASGEFIHFLKDRFDQLITIPYEFNMIAFTHNTNTCAQENNQKSGFNFWDTFEPKYQDFLKKIKKNL